MDSATRLKKLLEEHGKSNTRQRLLVFEALQDMNEPITTVQLVARLKGLDKVSVYRTVKLFGEIGITHRLWTGFQSKIELSEAFSPHHHHFTCIKCGQSISLKSETLETSLHELEKQHGFQLTHHSVELSGYCNNCSKKP